MDRLDDDAFDEAFDEDDEDEVHEELDEDRFHRLPSYTLAVPVRETFDEDRGPDFDDDFDDEDDDGPDRYVL